MGDIPEVLFVCTHNAGRSQMAAALLDHQAAGRVRVTSAGSQPAGRLNPAVSPRWSRHPAKRAGCKIFR
jgi:arsenate reductase (thioredoxin)